MSLGIFGANFSTGYETTLWQSFLVLLTTIVLHILESYIIHEITEDNHKLKPFICLQNYKIIY